MSFVYEVNVCVPVKEDAGAFQTFMSQKHLPDVQSTGKFTSIRFTIERPEALGGKQTEVAPPSFVNFRTLFIASSEADLQSYLTDHAPRLRQDAIKHMPPGCEVSRRVWETVKEWY